MSILRRVSVRNKNGAELQGTEMVVIPMTMPPHPKTAPGFNHGHDLLQRFSLVRSLSLGTVVLQRNGIEKERL